MRMLLLILVMNFLSGALPRLVMVHLVFRHGDRSPCHFYPTDPNNWEEGAGKLTNRGKRMCFELGKWIRKEFYGFLSKKYKADEVRVRSTDTDRTIMSAQLVLAGLFPPKGRQVWLEGLSWQPIPVHSVPEEMDKILVEQQSCERIKQIEDQLKKSSYMTETVYKANKDLFLYLTKHSGLNITTLKQLNDLYDTLLVESIHNKTLPSWTESVFPGGKFDQLRRLSFIVDTFNDELKRLKAGPFYSELLSHYQAQANGNLTKLPKMLMYSAHDITLVRLMNSLGVYNNQPPPYSSMLIFALHKEGKQFMVSLSLRNSTTSPPYPLIVPGCHLKCPLENFRNVVMDVTTDDLDNECNKKEITK